MQTFLPYPSFSRSSAVLDRQRLGKQRVETKQILLALGNKDYGWQNHPAVKMWRGHELSLAQYGEAICSEWIKRGYKDTLLEFFVYFIYINQDLKLDKPRWIGSKNFHRSHKSNLLRKFPEHYRKYWPTEPENLPYVWPV